MKIYELSNGYPHKPALQALLGQYLNCKPNQVVIQININGKLWHPEIHFNLSHSHGRVLMALDRKRPVGIDLEAHRPVPRMAAISKRFGFPEVTLTGFFDHWTQREALIKAQGLSLLQNPDPAGWSVQKLDVGNGWSAHLAFQGPQDPLESFDVQVFPSELLDW